MPLAIQHGRRSSAGLHTTRAHRFAVGAIILLLFAACDRGDSIDERTAATTEIASGEANAADPQSRSAFTTRPKRIILISLDTVGARHVGGYSDAETPTIERIAQDGVRFDRFYAASTYTLPSHMSMLTGLDPIEHGVNNLPAALAPEVPTLATQLGKAGYRTKSVTEAGFVGKIHGFDRGFDEVEERKSKQVVKTSIWGILDWMREEQEAPYFLFVHTYIAHTPYRGFAEFRDRHPELGLPDDAQIEALKDMYNQGDTDAFWPAPRDVPTGLRHVCTFYNMLSEGHHDYIRCGDRFLMGDFLKNRNFETYREGLVHAHREGIRRGDRMVGQIRDLLIELGQLEDTLLVVTSDHGDAIYEHSVHEHDYLPFDEVIKIPLVLSYPRRVRGGQVVRALTWHLDLFPTILSLAGASADPDLQGLDLSAALLEREPIAADRAIYPLLLRPANRSHMPRRRMALKGDFKFIEGHELYGDPEGLLFDLKNSPGEDDNLRESQPEMFEELRELALDYDGSLTPGEPVHQETKERISPFPGDVEPLEMSEEVRRGLAEIGYFIDDEEPQEEQ